MNLININSEKLLKQVLNYIVNNSLPYQVFISNSRNYDEYNSTLTKLFITSSYGSFLFQSLIPNGEKIKLYIDNLIEVKEIIVTDNMIQIF